MMPCIRGVNFTWKKNTIEENPRGREINKLAIPEEMLLKEKPSLQKVAFCTGVYTLKLPTTKNMEELTPSKAMVCYLLVLEIM